MAKTGLGFAPSDDRPEGQHRPDLERDILAADILIVDDQIANVQLLSRLLTEAGYTRITSSTDPTEVCGLHRRNGFDLILLDLQMPGMDGFGVMEGLKTGDNAGYLPVIVLTAQPGHKLRALQAGARDFISKPFDLVEVKMRIHNMLEVRLLYRNMEACNKALEQAAIDRTEELSQLGGQLLTAREDEKAHLARELHDELGALLTAAKLDSARLRSRLPEDPTIAARLEQLNKRLDECIALKRRVVENLRPSSLTTLGLTISLADLCADVGARLSITIQTEFDEVDLTDEGHLAIYRLVQEALTNVSKHAKATRVSVSVKSEPPQVRLQVEDNGIGFDPSAHKPTVHGISGMRFRVERLRGSMSLDSRPGAGTRLVALMPAAQTGRAMEAASVGKP